MLMDVLEEAVERRGLRGDFLPMELGQKGARLLNQRWSGPSGPPQYERVARENKLDIFDLSSLPPIGPPAGAPSQQGTAPSRLPDVDRGVTPSKAEEGVLDADEGVIE